MLLAIFHPQPWRFRPYEACTTPGFILGLEMERLDGYPARGIGGPRRPGTAQEIGWLARFPLTSGRPRSRLRGAVRSTMGEVSRMLRGLFPILLYDVRSFLGAHPASWVYQRTRLGMPTMGSALSWQGTDS